MESGPYLVWIDNDLAVGDFVAGDITRITKSPYKGHYMGRNQVGNKIELMQQCLEDAAKMLDKFGRDRFVAGRVAAGDGDRDFVERCFPAGEAPTALREVVPVAVALFNWKKEDGDM